MSPNGSSIPITQHSGSKQLVKVLVCAIGVVMAAMALLPSQVSGYRESGQKSATSEGAKIFADNCVECHAADGHGLMLNQPNFADPDWQRKVTDDELTKVIKWGREPMPFWVGALSDQQIAAVVKFIRTLGKAGAGDTGPRRPSAALTTDQEPRESPTSATTAQGDSCADCHKKRDEKVLSLYAQSVHAKAGKSCNSCHGGDDSAAGKAEAHSLNFVGKPTSDQAVRMCGSCHRQEMAEYRASHHFPVQKGVSRVACVECHGAHTVGAPARNFSVAYFCSGCHGLEYLPGLQQQFQDMLKLSDDLRLGLEYLRDAGHPPSEEILKRRKEIQQLTGELVHKTELEGGTAKIPHILELGEKLKAMINQQR